MKPAMVFLRIIGIGLGASLIVGEALRSWGQDRPLVFVVDDFLFGGALVIAAWFARTGAPVRLRALAAAFAGCAGLLYSSFFTKLVGPPGHSSNIDETVLTALVGAAFVTSVIGLVASLLIPANSKDPAP
ncbi:MAG: hypothetical protein ABL308_02035 [Oceanicaulis sp.]